MVWNYLAYQRSSNVLASVYREYNRQCIRTHSTMQVYVYTCFSA